ncbi:hypothetical protein ACM41_14570 [Bradyrhizobium sp. CCBAU 21362]|nr:hypothetical protein [Bradyrhizobium sp. CCBAU 21362]
MLGSPDFKLPPALCGTEGHGRLDEAHRYPRRAVIRYDVEFGDDSVGAARKKRDTFRHHDNAHSALFDKTEKSMNALFHGKQAGHQPSIQFGPHVASVEF